MARPIRLLLIDDSRADQILEKILLEQVFYAVVVDVQQDVPDALEKLMEYDGIVLDEMLIGGVSGTDIARQIHELDWKMPIMLVTGAASSHTKDALMYVDQIADKGDQVDIILKATAFVRGINRLKGVL